MSRIKIKNFGPIRDGFVDNEGWMDINKVTVFIGNQASGKSTAAKLVSVFSWLEKNVVRNNISVELLNAAVFKSLCAQQELFEYFVKNTYLSYEGEVCLFEYTGENDSFAWKVANEKIEYYISPKIQYVSAARNLLTILYNISLQNIVDSKGNIIDMASNIPFMVRELNKEYLKALSELAQNGFPLPISDTSVYFQNYSTFIVTKGTMISMSAASSGIQSITPLLLVSYYLSKEVQKDLFVKVQSIDNNLKDKIANELRKKNEKWVEKFTQYCSFGKEVLSNDDVLLLEQRLRNFIPSSFINIVEEPEQNLFPNSQQKILSRLLEFNNAAKENKLIISTHSPYILTALNNSILAEEVFEKTGRSIDAYTPEKRVAFADVAAYQFEDGRIVSIKDEDTKLIDAEAIDSCSTEINSDFDALLDLLPENDD